MKTNNYGFWRLYKAQWTIKNETHTFVIYFLISLLLTYILFVSGIVQGLVPFALIIYCFTLLLNGYIMYQLFKVIIFFFLCYLVNYLVDEKEPLSISNYNNLFNRLREQ